VNGGTVIRKLSSVAPLLVALAAAALVAPTAASAARSACVPGKTTVAGLSAMRFCGPAKAVAMVGAKRFTFAGGRCQKLSPYFTVNIGTLVVHPTATSKPGPTAYFGITMTPAVTGVHLTQALSWTFGGKAYSVVANRITVDKGFRGGSFTGKSLTGQKITGTFTC
jgi:hypothetical protein